ncbi:MAG: adenosylcobinamide-phosphate synthase CbiB [Tissierellales bacterium]
MTNNITLILAIALDYILGDPPNWPHPVRFIGTVIKKYEKLVRSLKGLDLKVGGFILTIATLATVLGFFTVVLALADVMHPILRTALEIYLIYSLLAAKCLEVEAMKVYRALEAKDIAKSRHMLSYLVGRDTNELNTDEIIRGTVETVAENTVDGVLAPLLYLGIGFCFNAPVQGILLYKIINTLDSMVGYIQEPYTKIGFASAKLDDFANFIPARLGSILMILAGTVIGYKGKKGMQILVRDRKNHKSPNCGYPESVVAGLLEIQLGGTNTYFGQKAYKPTIGDAHKDLNQIHIKDTIKIMYGSEVAMVLFMILVFNII